MIKYQSSTLLSFPNYQFHLLHYITFVEQKVMIQLGDCQVIFFALLPSLLISLSLCLLLSLTFSPPPTPFSSSVFRFGFRLSRLPVEIKRPCPLGERVSPVNCLRQEVTGTGSYFTDSFMAVAEHPKEAERWERLCMLRLLALHFSPLFNFGYQSIPQGEGKGLLEAVGCKTDYIKMLYQQ